MIQLTEIKFNDVPASNPFSGQVLPSKICWDAYHFTFNIPGLVYKDSDDEWKVDVPNRFQKCKYFTIDLIF